MSIEIDVVVEVPMGSRNKYEVDHETGVIRLDRQLFTSTRYPCEYGFIEHTHAEDGDPLDALVCRLTNGFTIAQTRRSAIWLSGHIRDGTLVVVGEPTFPGCHIHCRPIGVFSMFDEAGPDDKILAVPVWERSRSWHELEDVPKQLLLEIRHFFDVYKDLEEGKWTRVGGWQGREAAEREIDEAMRRHAEMGS